MTRQFAYRCAALAVVAMAAACARAVETESPVATPSVTLARAEAAVGAPLEMRYRFVVASTAPAFGEDYWVFVHFLDRDGEMMWTDDHPPATPTRAWKAGQTIEYDRTMFVPKFPYVGQARIEVGLFSPKTGARLPMSGETKGQRAYQVATFALRLQTDNLYVVFKDGWHETEVADEGGGGGVEWQWSKKEASLAFRNPKRDAVLYFQCDQPAQGLGEQQRVELRVGSNVIDTFTLDPGQKVLRKVAVSTAQLGDGDIVDVTVAVDKTFVPASREQLRSSDPRELGIRVFRAYVEAG